MDILGIRIIIVLGIGISSLLFTGCDSNQYADLHEPVELQRAILPEPYRISHGDYLSIKALPATIQVDEGKLGLFADYTDISEQRIPVYIVNKTNKPISIPTSDGNPYIKLESLNRNNTWERAQSHQDYIICNLGIDTTELPPHSFFKVSAPYYTEGKSSTIRYSMYNRARYPGVGSVEVMSISSNQGVGCVIPSVIRACKTDTLAMQIQRASDEELASTP